MANQENQEHTTFYDQADSKFDRTISKKQRLAKGVVEDDHESESVTKQVRDTEDASLQDDSYSFDEQNTDNEEYHDASDADDFDLDNDDDFVH